MSDVINQELAAFGVAQVMVFLKPSPAVRGAAAKPSAALAAAIPVRSSRTRSSVATNTVMKLAGHFTIRETALDSGMAASATRTRSATAGAAWFRKAKSPTNPTPPVRYFPNLGIMLGSCDKAGLAALKKENQVAAVMATPILSLIRPVASRPVKVSKPRTRGAAAASAASYEWGIKRINAHKLHQRGFTGTGITVGHLDTGIDGEHQALKPALQSFAEFDFMGFQVSPTPDAHDTGDHGTHTAGTIAGRTVNSRAIGVAPDAMLASAIVIEGGNIIARILAGMDWAIGEGARILNMSLGIRGYNEEFLALTQLLRSKGVLPVFAVGNEGPSSSRSPGNYSEALSVGAMGSNDLVADFSSSQLFQRPIEAIVPDLVAPGVDVVSAMPGGGYQFMNGTSMATPHIAGLAALLMQAKPACTIDQIEKAIFDSCSPLSGELGDRQNRGVPDAVRALQLLP